MTVQQWLCYGCLACLKSTLTALWLCLIWWLLKNSTTYPATSSGWQIRSWQRWTRPILWAHLFMWHFTKAIWLTRPFEQLHLLLLFRNIAGFIPTHKVDRLPKVSFRFDLIEIANMASYGSQFSPFEYVKLYIWELFRNTRTFELLHLLLFFRNIACFIPTHKVIRLLKFSVMFDLIILAKMAITSCPVGMGACLYESCLEW